MIGIVDYGMGNLFSVNKALERLQAPYFVSDDKTHLMKADGLLLPGVGSFKDAMALLVETGLADMMKEYVKSRKPLLGICLGMQLLFEESEENGLTNGLDLLPGGVKRFPGVTEEGIVYKVPHMGWNQLRHLQPSPLLKNSQEDYVYFVHSYYVEPSDPSVVLASSKYDVNVPAVVGRENVFGMQFHPEKSGKLGIRLLQNFVDMVEERMAVS
jgi:imidazole glycerol-phosphate synthase subunit HisH